MAACDRQWSMPATSRTGLPLRSRRAAQTGSSPPSSLQGAVAVGGHQHGRHKMKDAVRFAVHTNYRLALLAQARPGRGSASWGSKSPAPQSCICHLTGAVRLAVDHHRVLGILLLHLQIRQAERRAQQVILRRACSGCRTHAEGCRLATAVPVTTNAGAWVASTRGQEQKWESCPRSRSLQQCGCTPHHGGEVRLAGCGGTHGACAWPRRPHWHCSNGSSMCGCENGKMTG